MAIDNENKRRSVIRIFPVPDGSINAGDRRHIAGFYRGLADVPSSIYPIDLVLSEQDIYGVTMNDGNIYRLAETESNVFTAALSEKKIYDITYSSEKIYIIKLTETDTNGDPLT